MDAKPHNKIQRLTFFSLLEKYIDEDLFLPKIIEKLKHDLSQKERKAIEKRVEETEINEPINTLKVIALLYCLHVQTPKHGYISMFTKHLIKDTKIEFEPDFIKETNKKLQDAIEDIGLPKIEGTPKRFIQNIYFYKPDFLDKYPDLDTKLNS